tara:strand:+ start:3693 stop:3962 length:270 start_codon:yes stop_codon:yes gene_type:complete
MNTQLKIENKLKENFNIFELRIEDNSHKHKNHKKDTTGGHFNLLIVSDDFIDVPLIQRHRLIYKVLDEMIKVNIHALSIKAKTKLEYQN